MLKRVLGIVSPGLKMVKVHQTYGSDSLTLSTSTSLRTETSKMASDDLMTSFVVHEDKPAILVTVKLNV